MSLRGRLAKLEAVVAAHEARHVTPIMSPEERVAAQRILDRMAADPVRWADGIAALKEACKRCPVEK